MDAYSYICRGNVFANAQTGNILLFGVNLSTGNFSLAIRYLFPVIAFTLGIAIAEIIRHKFENNERFHWRQFVILSEVLILFIVLLYLNPLIFWQIVSLLLSAGFKCRVLED